MTASLETPTQLQLESSPAAQIDCWQQAQVGATPKAVWQIYLNQSCVNAFLPWLQAEHVPQAQVWPSDRTLWELVNGTAITCGTKRLIVIPDKTIDTSELRVPQEWVDIPAWAGDYYLAAQVDPDTNQVRIWGFTTHAQVQAGVYDPDDRAYIIDAQSLIQDLNVLWVVQQLNADEPTRGTIAPLAPLAPTQAENLVQRLANPAIVQPRQAIPFTLWGALLAQDHLRQRLVQLRQGASPSVNRRVNLGQWWQNQFTEGWQALEALFAPEDLALNWRQSVDTPAEVRRVKELILPDQAVLLLVGLTPEADDRVSVRVQLRLRDRDRCLSPNVTLEMLTADGAVVQSVVARDQDNCIQLRRFRCAPSSQFQVRIAIDDCTITEDFLV
jgi:Protein of unknown function (DUF1822)